MHTPLRKLLSLPTDHVARALLGWRLVTTINGVATGGIIVETEAYTVDDPGAHGYNYKKTKRNEAMFLESGTIYVFLIYGLHLCFNIITHKAGVPEGVLIRALEPTVGVEEMARRRGGAPYNRLTTGPGVLTQALGITMAHNGLSLFTTKEITLIPAITPDAKTITVSPRIGLCKGSELLKRYYLKDNPFVSRR